VFDRCRSAGCQIQVYDLETGELAAYQSPQNERWTMGKYSYDGKKITFSVIPIKPNDDLDLGQMQIAVMAPDGKNYKKVTTGPGAKLYPAFSHNGKKILYARAARIREKGKTPAADYDAWEVNLETGKQTQLTFFEYFYMGNLTYFPDDERFIYYGELPDAFPGERYGYKGSFQKNMFQLAREGKNIHGLVVMKGQELIPNPYVFPAKTFPQKPLLNKDGSVMIYEKDLSAGKFFLYSPDGKHRLVGSGGSVNSAAISPDGKILGMITVNLNIHIFSVQDGKRQIILYVPYAKKKIVNWEEAYRGSENLYRMIPEKQSCVLNQ
jgi:Tol biopolymer transport system component